ncbi:MAG: ABC transporter permease [Hyphomicrobiales bacterium]|nr:ABC transporter permease [Hyphomicrobiales bacterium]
MSEDAAEPLRARPRRLMARLGDSDALASLLASPTTVAAGVITVALIAAAALAPWVAPTDPYNPATNFLSDALTPPRFIAGGDPRFLLGADDQGRDLWSAILYGLRISLVIGGASVLFGAAIGVTLGLVAGYAGGWLEAIIMRLADVQLTFPAILIALLVDGVAQPLIKEGSRGPDAALVLIVSIGLSFWVQYARTVRASTLVEKNRDYVQAARLIGLRPLSIVTRHILPNVMGPVLVIATINLALAVITEATLSFLGVGLPPTQPSLGTLIRIGQNYLFSGEWWIVAFPALALATLVLAVNLLGDWLRDALNPKLK